MGYYFLQLFIFLSYSSFFYFIRGNFLKIYYMIIVLHLSLVMGLRAYWVGTDTSMYVNIFLNRNTAFNGNGVMVYNFLNKVIWQFTNGNYHIFLFVLSFLTVCFFILSLYELNYDFITVFFAVYIYITFYFYFDSFNIQRQMLAVSFIMFSVSKFNSRKYVKGTVAFLFGVGIHSTAILGLFDILLVKIKKTKKNLCIIILISIVAVLSIGKMVKIFSILFDHYDMYTSILANGSLSSGGGTLFLGIFLLIVATISYTMIDIFEDRFFLFTFIVTIIGSIFYILGMHSQLLIRTANYFLIFTTVFIPEAIKKVSRRFSQNHIVEMLSFMVVFIVGIIIMYYKLQNNFGQIIPYATDF